MLGAGERRTAAYFLYVRIRAFRATTQMTPPAKRRLRGADIAEEALNLDA